MNKWSSFFRIDLSREELWRANSYKSCNISMESDEEVEEEEEKEERNEEEESVQPRKRDIHYVIGDVTHPQDTGSDINIIIHCADDSGRWGRGGLFTAVSARSDSPQQKYDLAGRMKDLELGDCHLFPMDYKEVDMLGLIIAQHRDRKNNLSGIHLSALSQGLKRIFHVAKSRKGSVHLPRIGHDTPGFNWYGTERLIKKHLASRGIPTYIYYFPRKKQLKRKSEENEEAHKGKGKQYKSSLSTESESKSCVNDGDKDSSRQKSKSHSDTSLPSIFQGVLAYLHGDSIPANEIKNLKRYIVTYPLSGCPYWPVLFQSKIYIQISAFDANMQLLYKYV
ncbi:hypothetical protein CHS0354_005846 [Potamilus streckersoni]|uniref:Macro domain-containing protein n=1 Tax=Potamilus streckersoni TaxID=2493646 RepID=A0AAE0TF46_9BIVA|nr:hypothetical protein CHS0354_005846 [Potamilus streckersoni]